MELSEATQRIFKRHWAVILLFMLIGLSVPIAIDRIAGTSYIGTARMNFGADPHGGQDATSLGDTGQGLATSPSVLEAALKQAKVSRSVPDMLANNVVTVTPVGTSGVLDVSVTDPDQRAAAAIANALATRIVQIREQAQFGASQDLLVQLERQESVLNQQIASVVAQAKASTLFVPYLQAQQQNLSAQRAAVDQQVQQLSQAIATTPHPQLIDTSQRLGVPAQRGLTVLLVLGGLLGLVLGVAVAATVEAARPTLTPESVGRRLDAPVLGRVPATNRGISRLDPWLPTYVSVAAEQAGVDVVQLVPVGRRPADVASLAQALNAHVPDVTVTPLSLPSARSAELPPVPGGRQKVGIVVVSPHVVKGKFLAPLERHLRVTKQPVLGLITYQGRLSRVTTGGTIPELKPILPAPASSVAPTTPAAS